MTKRHLSQLAWPTSTPISSIATIPIDDSLSISRWSAAVPDGLQRPSNTLVSVLIDRIKDLEKRVRDLESVISDIYEDEG